MKYVDNLLEVDPKDIRHESKASPIQAILKINNPMYMYNKTPVLVVFEDGDAAHYTIDGRDNPTSPARYLIFKPKKVKKLKPLHVVLTENPRYYVNSFNSIVFDELDTCICTEMLRYFGTKDIPHNYYWSEFWIEEVDEKADV
jgi:hypothetical protein